MAKRITYFGDFELTVRGDTEEDCKKKAEMILDKTLLDTYNFHDEIARDCK